VKKKKRPSYDPKQRGSLGPCQFCEYEPTHSFIGTIPPGLQPTCDLCYERVMAAWALLRMPEFYVI